MPHFIYEPDVLNLMAQVDVPEHKAMRVYRRVCASCGRPSVSAYDGRCSLCGFENEQVIESEAECQLATGRARIAYVAGQLSDEGKYGFGCAKNEYQMALLEMTEEERRDHSSAIAVIYGPGGWHRWMVTATGEIRFSFHHAMRGAHERATELGFARW